MADIAFVLVAVVFFALCVGYVRGCERIIGAAPAGAGDDEHPAGRPERADRAGEAVAP
ncbi:hypothetical protein LG943_18590 [Streptomonospora sp. S1-112]|uniref:Potassium-transporting ATPase subunit A n=1 Tax=Streptomonospora mangrovi TaxID=2883123 RepID=A0A9X3SEX3_9ACTN|nr:hypothetical protein [Streptomonospora mangrovi]MDA0566308.1 hypothetical protein [Streptomonospora mangrovi]